MIRESITINYECEGVNVRLDVAIDDELPYTLAEAFRRVIVDSNVNAETLLGELKSLLENE